MGENNQNASSSYVELSENHLFVLSCMHKALGKILRITHTQHGGMLMILALCIKSTRLSSAT